MEGWGIRELGGLKSRKDQRGAAKCVEESPRSAECDDAASALALPLGLCACWNELRSSKMKGRRLLCRS